MSGKFYTNKVIDYTPSLAPKPPPNKLLLLELPLLIGHSILAVTLGATLRPIAYGARADVLGDAIEQLIATDKRMQRAFVDRDVAVLERILTDDYVLVVPDGREQTKAQILEEVKSGAIVWELNETKDWEVRVHGGTGIVVATLHTKGVNHGMAFNRVVKFSDTYILERNSWRNVHAHTCVSQHLDADSPIGRAPQT